MDNCKHCEYSKVDLETIADTIKKELCLGAISQSGSTIYYKSKLLDFSNDEIILKIELDDNQIKISDDNRTILSLLSAGFDPFSTKHKGYLIDSLTEAVIVGKMYRPTSFKRKEVPA